MCQNYPRRAQQGNSTNARLDPHHEASLLALCTQTDVTPGGKLPYCHPPSRSPPLLHMAAASTAEQAGAVSAGAAGSGSELDVGSVVSLKDDPSIHGTVTGKANGYWDVRLADGSGTKKLRLRALQPYGQQSELELDEEAERQEQEGDEEQQPPEDQNLLARPPRVRKQTSFLVLESEQPQPEAHCERNRKRRAVQTSAAARQPLPTQPAAPEPVVPKHQAPKHSPETLAGTAGATVPIDKWLPPEQVEKLLRKCTSTGKAPKGFRLYSADTTLDLPGAGTVFFQEYHGVATKCPDEHEWKHSEATNRISDAAISDKLLTVRGKQVVKGRHVRHHIDKNFQRRVYTLLDDVAVRLVQYIHTEGAHQPIGPSGSRVKLKQAPPSRAASASSAGAGVAKSSGRGSGRAPKRARRNSAEASAIAEQPPLQLKEDAIAFSSHVVVTAAALAGQQRKKHWKVLIVGAGAAGLAAAQQLRSDAAAAAGLSDDDVLVLEGGDRLGGRIHTQHFPAVAADAEGRGGLRGCRVDLGASYLHGYDFEDYLVRTGQEMNPLQSLAKEHGLKVKVDRHVPQQYSNGWRAHSAWFVNAPGGDNAGRPVVAKKGRESSWNGPDRVFAIDAEIDHLLQKRAQQLNEMEPPLDSNVAEEWESVRDEVLSKSKYAAIDQDKVRKILASMAVVKWGFCGALEERSLCDAFGVTVAKEEDEDEAINSDEGDEEEEVAATGSTTHLTVGSAVWLKKDPSVHGTVIGKANGYWAVRLGGAGSGRDETTKKFRHWDLQWSRQEQLAADRALATSAKVRTTAGGGAVPGVVVEEANQWPGMYDAMMLNGYGEVIEVLSRGVKIATGARVQTIAYSPSSPNADNGRGPVEVKVSLARGATGGESSEHLILTADYVIVTVSLGVLQTPVAEGGILFTPALPSSDNQLGEPEQEQEKMLDQSSCGGDAAGEAGRVLKRDAIAALGFGHENKIVLRFVDRFWRAGGGAGAKHTHWQCLDQRFRFINLDAVGKDGTIVAHAGPPFSVDFVDPETGERYSDEQVVDEVSASSHTRTDQCIATCVFDSSCVFHDVTASLCGHMCHVMPGRCASACERCSIFATVRNLCNPM